MSGHSTLSPSSRYRWANCPGSIHEIVKAPPELPSKYAEAGNVAHDIAAQKLNEWALNSRSGKILSAVPADHDELFPYLKHVADLAGTGHTVAIEKRVTGLIPYHPKLWGRLDASVRTPEILHVVDLKWGQGTQVPIVDEDGENPQLELYGIGELLEAPTPYMQLHIVQPRGFSDGLPAVRSSDLITCQDAFDVRLPKLLAEAKRVDETQPGEGLNPGPWCSKTFCPARVTCPAIKKAVQETANPFTPVREVVDLSTSATIQRPYSQDEVAALLSAADLAADWIKEVHKFAMAEAEAGHPPTGYQIDQGWGKREWNPESNVSAIVRATGLKKRECTEDPKLKSPTQLEKAVDPEKWAKITEKHVIRKRTKKKLVKVSEASPQIEETPFKPQEMTVVSEVLGEPITEDFLPDVTAMLGEGGE